MLAAGSAEAQRGDRVATLEITNAPGIQRSECVISGKRSAAPEQGSVKFLTKQLHEGAGKSASYDLLVPVEFVGVRYQCRPLLKSDGKAPDFIPKAEQSKPFVEQIIARAPLNSQYAKVSCARGQCVHELLVR